jgi:2-dehydropantoate 2-reductase
MKIAVVGTGGVGGYFGGKLAHSGQDVTFVARGSHLAAIQANGLQVKSAHGDFIVFPAQATDDMADIGPVDLALVCVKDFQLAEIIPLMKPLVGERTAVLPLLNGIRAAEQLSEAFGRECVLGGLCSVVAFIESPGVIRQSSPFHRVAFGEWDGQMTDRVKAIDEAFAASGVENVLSEDVLREMWTKFIFITAYSGVASVVRLPAAGLHACDETMALLREVMAEIEAVGRAKGVALPEDVVDKTMDFIQGLPPEATSSMQRDVEAGHMFELEALTGSVVRYGQETNVPTPVNRVLYAALKPQLLSVQPG